MLSLLTTAEGKPYMIVNQMMPQQEFAIGLFSGTKPAVTVALDEYGYKYISSIGGYRCRSLNAVAASPFYEAFSIFGEDGQPVIIFNRRREKVFTPVTNDWELKTAIRTSRFTRVTL